MTTRTPTTTTTTTITTDVVDSPIGPLRYAVRNGALVGLAFDDGDWVRVERLVRDRFPGDPWSEGEEDRAEPVRVALVAYLGGDLDAIDRVTVDAGGTPFQKAVWSALRTIPVGETWSYGELAAAVGSPGAMRAVGSANGANPVPVVVPCHRVVRSDGSLGGYGGGLDRKVWLLRHEGARLV